MCPYYGLSLNTTRRDKVLERAKLLKEIKATLSVIPIISVVRPFSMDRFWQRVLKELPDEEGFEASQVRGRAR